LPNRIPLP